MLRSTKALIGYRLAGLDGEIGKCKDFLIDDRQWGLRYMVADTGRWLPGRKVLVSPIALGDADWFERCFSVRLSKEQIETCPPLDADMPVSREYEKRWSRHYGFPYYWAGDDSLLWGTAGHPGYLFRSAGESEFPEDPGEDPDSHHLRSISEMTGYNISALDEDIGHAEDFIIDDDTWAIRYVVVDTRNWLPGGKKVLVSKSWIQSVSWKFRKLDVDLEKSQIESGPEYDPAMPINREYEMRMYDFYGRPHPR